MEKPTVACVWCKGKYPQSGSTPTKKYCTLSCCQQANQARRQGIQSRDEWLNEVAKRQAPRPCEMCQTMFKADRLYQVTCSTECSQRRSYQKTKAFMKTPEGRALNRKMCKTYRESASGRKVKTVYARKWQKTEKGRACNLRGAKRHYQRKKTEGICVGSGCWKKSLAGHVFCRAHLLKMREDTRVFNKRAYEKKKAMGLCIHGGCKSRAESGLRCLLHRDQARTRDRQRRSREKE